MIDLAISLIILLGLVAIIDLFYRVVPSIFLTGLLLATALIHLYMFEVGLISITFGILAFVYAWFLYEAEFIGGIADVKFISIIGLMISSVQIFFVLMLLIVLFGMIYKLIFRYGFKKDKAEEIPFIPSLYAVYIVLYFIGGIA
jgi:hypothetical protein